MPYFPLPFRATIKRPIVVPQRSGQPKVAAHSTVEPAVKCMFLVTSGNKRTAMREDFEAVMAFYLEPSVDIQEGDIVENILDRNGSVIEPGPFEVLSVKKVGGFKGKVHHKSCKLRGLA
jgi:hypothetical protein